MVKKIFSIFILVFFALFISHTIFALDSQSVTKTAKDLYLINPLDNSETIKNTDSVIYNNAIYWVLETNQKDLFILKDKNTQEFVSDDTIKPVIQTYLFFSGMKSQNNKTIAYYYNAIPDIINNFNYNIELVQKQLEQDHEYDLNVINGLVTVQSKAKDIGKLSIDITNILLDLDSNLSKKTYSNFLNVKKLSKKLEESVKDMQTKLTQIQASILNLKMVLVDANISMNMKATIGNQTLQLPQQIQQIPQYNQQVSNNLNAINTAIAPTKDFKSFDTLKTNWDSRLKRVNFLKQYLDQDKDIKKQTHLDNPKALFDTIIASNNWKDYKDANSFSLAYKKMYSDLENKEYESAQRQIKPLKEIALKIYKEGKQTIQNIGQSNSTNPTKNNQQENKTNPFILISIIVVLGILVVIFVINIIKKIKQKKEKDKTKDEPEIKLDF